MKSRLVATSLLFFFIFASLSIRTAFSTEGGKGSVGRTHKDSDSTSTTTSVSTATATKTGSSSSTGLGAGARNFEREEQEQYEERKKAESSSTSTSVPVSPGVNMTTTTVSKPVSPGVNETTTTTSYTTGAPGMAPGSPDSSTNGAESLNGVSILDGNSGELDTSSGGTAGAVTDKIPLNIALRRDNKFILIGNEDESDHDADTDLAWQRPGVAAWFAEKSDRGGHDDTVQDGLARDNVTIDSTGNSLLLVLGDGKGGALGMGWRGGIKADEAKDLQGLFPNSKIARLFGTEQETTMSTFDKWFQMVNGKYYCILGVNDDQKGAYSKCAGDVIDAHKDILVKCLLSDPNDPKAVEGEDVITKENISIIPDCLGNVDESLQMQVPMVKIGDTGVQIPFGADVIVLGGGPGCYATSVRDEEEKALYPYFRKVFHVASHGGSREHTAKALEDFLAGSRATHYVSADGGNSQDPGSSEDSNSDSGSSSTDGSSSSSSSESDGSSSGASTSTETSSSSSSSATSSSGSGTSTGNSASTSSGQTTGTSGTTVAAPVQTGNFNAQAFPGFYDARNDRTNYYNIPKILKDVPNMWAKFGDLFKKVGAAIGVDPYALAAYCVFESYNSDKGNFNPRMLDPQGDMVAAGIGGTQAQYLKGTKVPGLSVTYPPTTEATATCLRDNPEYSLRSLAVEFKEKIKTYGDIARAFPMVAYPAWKNNPSRSIGAYGTQAQYVSRAKAFYDAFRAADGNS